MRIQFTKRDVALAAIAAIGSATLSVAPSSVSALEVGNYVSGDFHNHSTCSDGSISVQNLVKKSTVTWGLDWFVQAGHGNSGGTRNCTLVEDTSLATPLYPFTSNGPTTTWTSSIGNANVKGNQPGTGGAAGYMWRWQSVQEYQYPLMEYLSALKGVPLFMGLEQNPWGHEHVSMSIIDGQMPNNVIDGNVPLTGTNTGVATVNYSSGQAVVTGGRYIPTGNANALAQHVYCFDSTLTDLSRGNLTNGTPANNWDCTNPNSPDSGQGTTINGGAAWNTTGKKLIPVSGSGSGTNGDLITQEAVKWLRDNAANTSYFVPAHLERAGPFSQNNSRGWNIEHLRNFNNISSSIAFGFETQPGHGASSERGEYFQCRNSGFTTNSPGCNAGVQDSVGGTTYGGTGVYGAQIGGVWDALLSEGRAYWFFASSDWHNRGIFATDDRRSTQDFQPGEYQKTYVLVRNGADKVRPQTIVDGLRSGNAFSASGALVDRLGFIACSGLSESQAGALALQAAVSNAPVDGTTCANMGQKLTVASNTNIVIAIAVRNPSGPGNNKPNNSPYVFPNPSLLQPAVNVSQPLNMPILDHVDLIGGQVLSTPKAPSDANYAGQWPSDWLSKSLAGAASLTSVPAAAKNITSGVLTTFSGSASNWTSTVAAGGTFLVMTATIPSATASQYVRLRGTNLPANTPFETDASGNPLADWYTNNTANTQLSIPCSTVGTVVPPVGGRAPYTKANIDGCPTHLPTVTGRVLPGYPAGYTGKMVAFDVAAWSDLWFYSNPIYVEVSGSVPVAGVSGANAIAGAGVRRTARVVATK